MNDPAEIPTDLSSDELADRLERAFAQAGWLVGADDATPHRGALYYRPRSRSASFDLAGVAPATERSVVEAVAREHAGRIGYVADTFSEWRAGEELIRLDRSGGGSYRGAAWVDIRSGAEDPEDLPDPVLAALRAEPWPDVDRVIEVLVDHLYGEPLEVEADVALLEVHHPYEDALRPALEPLFLRVRELVANAGEAKIPGLVSFRRIESERGLLEAVHRPGDSLRACVADGAALEVDLEPVLGPGPDPAIAAALEAACAMVRSGGVDVLLGADLALHAMTVPAQDTINPRTGEPMSIPARKVPIFLGW